MTIRMEIIWITLILVSLALVIGLVFIFAYFKRNGDLRKEVDGIVKDVNYMRKLFDAHFKVTNETIKDLRKERDELKKKLR